LETWRRAVAVDIGGASRPNCRVQERRASESSIRSRETIVGVFADKRRGTLLDIPAGAGDESRALGALGYRVCSVDLFPDSRGATSMGTVCADASFTFPFRDRTFDYVLSREGIEHLENQSGFSRECARVLKPGGTIVVTTPNLMHLSARASQFLTGQRNLRRGLANEVQTLRGSAGARLHHGHIFLIDYFRMRYILRLAGFDRLRVSTDRYSPTSIALCWCAPILYSASKFSLWSAARNARRKGYTETPGAVAREILGHVFSPALLFGKRMIVIAEKPLVVRQESLR
jgi:SAM-dependent methyltransferase